MRYLPPLMATSGLFSDRPFWAKRFGVARFLPRRRAEMDELGWEACDVIIVTGDAYVDHPSFGMAVIGRLLEERGYRVGILDQPDWHSTEAFRELGEPTLFFGVTGGNMDSLVNHYTSDKKPRNDDAYTPGGLAGARPDRASIVYTQRCREAYPDTPVILGGIEASLRRLAHYDYWSDKVRRSILVDSGADLLVYGNAERTIVELARRLARGEDARKILDVRGTVTRRPTSARGPVDDDSDGFRVERKNRLGRSTRDSAVGPMPVARLLRPPVAKSNGGDVAAIEQPSTSETDGCGCTAQQARQDAANAATLEDASFALHSREATHGFDGAAPQPPTDANESIGGAGCESRATARADSDVCAPQQTKPIVLRLASSDEVCADKALYAHTSRVIHQESNPYNARSLVQRNGDTDVWVNPPPLPLTTDEMDRVYGLPYQRLPHPDHQGKKIPAFEMIRFSVTIMRGCFGGCSFCSITEHEGRIIQSRSANSVLSEVRALTEQPGFTGTVSDLGGPTANMYRLGCKSSSIAEKCRKPSCVYPEICRNLNHDHGPLIELYRRARAVPGIKKIAIGSGLRYDLAVESPLYVKELVTHHVGGYLKIAPEHVAKRPLALMLKPGVASYERFKEMFDRFSREAGKQQYLIPYFIAAHPGTTDRDMLELSLWLKRNGYRPDQVQAFLPSPMSTATAMYFSGKNPLAPVETSAGDVLTEKSADGRRLHKAFLRYHDPENWSLLRNALVRLGRRDLIGHGAEHLVPPANSSPGPRRQEHARRKPRAR